MSAWIIRHSRTAEDCRFYDLYLDDSPMLFHERFNVVFALVAERSLIGDTLSFHALADQPSDPHTLASCLAALYPQTSRAPIEMVWLRHAKNMIKTREWTGKQAFDWVRHKQTQTERAPAKAEVRA